MPATEEIIYYYTTKTKLHWLLVTKESPIEVFSTPIDSDLINMFLKDELSVQVTRAEYKILETILS